VVKQEDRVIVGRFGRPHGIKGLVRVNSFTEPYDNILRYSEWHAFLNNDWQPIKLLSAQIRHNAIVAQVEGFSARESVALLTNVDIAVPKSHLATLSPGEYYWHQLIGMRVEDQEGREFGKVVEIMPTGSNDVLVVQGEKRHLIPYLPNLFVISINEETQTMIVDWDMGF
jgi:16S rRNA processing protein RimM